MTAVPAIITKPVEVEARLHELELTSSILRDSIMVGRVAWAGCSENDPRAFPGTVLWAVTTRALREQLLARGWTKSDAANYSTVKNADGSVAVVVATGDDGTGIPHRTPRTKYPKGPETAAVVEQNRVQLELFPAKVVPIGGGEKRPAMTWVLLIVQGQSAQGGNEFRGELSLPEKVGEDERIEEWRERIILEAITDDGEGLAVPVPEPGPDLDVTVVRRAG